MMLTLPTPALDAQQHSLRLQALIKERIKKHKKISFHDYMQQALYQPGLGYYSAGSYKLGAAGDFITAPEISPLFGASIARQCLGVMDALQQCSWLELGAGSGALAVAILLQLAKQNSLPQHYYILEVSADLKQRQQITLQAQLSEEIFAKVIWLDTLPETFQGVIIANEVLDALAVHRFHVDAQGAIKECFVTLNAAAAFTECLAAPSSDYLTQRIKQLNLVGPYRSEINLQQEALLKTLSRSLAAGVMIFIDYGFPSKEFYHPDRNQGTFMCHYQHRAHDDALFWPGLQDMTAHVDFTALARVGIESGLSLLHFVTQSAWLLQAGIVDLAQEKIVGCTDRDKLLQQQSLHKLLAMEEMGELFKFMVFAKNISETAMCCSPHDMRHRL